MFPDVRNCNQGNSASVLCAIKVAWSLHKKKLFCVFASKARGETWRASTAWHHLLIIQTKSCWWQSSGEDKKLLHPQRSIINDHFRQTRQHAFYAFLNSIQASTRAVKRRNEFHAVVEVKRKTKTLPSPEINFIQAFFHLQRIEKHRWSIISHRRESLYFLMPRMFFFSILISIKRMVWWNLRPSIRHISLHSMSRLFIILGIIDGVKPNISCWHLSWCKCSQRNEQDYKYDSHVVFWFRLSSV